VPARYFPVEPAPLRPSPGLFKLGTDFGNGAVDARWFQVDEAREATLAAKRAAPRERCQLDPERLPLLEIAAEVLEDRCRLEGIEVDAALRRRARGEAPSAGPGQTEDRRSVVAARLHAIGLGVQEDVVVVGDVRSAGALAYLHVCFPSGWRPERLLGESFAAVHAPIPDFVRDASHAAAMVRAMVERGPYVRFVWTVSASEALDQHPEAPGRSHFTARTPRAHLRVERQLTLPLPQGAGALFLIRVYLTPFDALDDAERSVLLRALTLMPEPLWAYKSLPPERAWVTRHLEPT
jgi:dimethylamine monooxygenase subunit A